MHIIVRSSEFGVRSSEFGVRSSEFGRSFCLNNNAILSSRETRKGFFFLSFQPVKNGIIKVSGRTRTKNETFGCRLRCHPQPGLRQIADGYFIWVLEKFLTTTRRQIVGVPPKSCCHNLRLFYHTPDVNARAVCPWLDVNPILTGGHIS